MEGDGMVAVVRGLREAGLAVTLLDGNRQYTLLPNTTTHPQAAPAQRAAPTINVTNAATQQNPPKISTENSTEPGSQLSAPQYDRDAQAVDGRYASTYKTMHCNIRPTSPPVQLAEFPPQRPDLHPGHGNFIVGGAGSGATRSQIRASSPVNSFRGGMCWPDRGSVYTPRPSHVVDEFAKSLRKYPNCLSPDRSSEVMERLVNYTQTNQGVSSPVSRPFRNIPSPTRISEQSSQNVLETKATFTKAIRNRSYEPDVTIRPKKTEDPPTRDRKRDEHHVRSYDVRCVRDMSKRVREGVKSYMSYPYSHPVCPPTIRENQDYQQSLSCDHQNSSNSVNMEIQAAVKMLSKEVATLPRGEITKKTVAVPESPISPEGEDYLEGEFYFVENLDIRTSFKSIQTNFYSSDTTLKPRKSAQTVFSTIDFHSSQNRTIVSRKTKSQEEIKVSKDELKISLLQLINEISDTVSKNTIRDELIKKLFVTDNCERIDHKCDRGKRKHGSSFCPTVCDYVGDYQELIGKLKHCYGGSKHVLRTEIKPFRLSEYRQLDFVLKDWVSQLNLKTSDIGRYVNRSELLNSIENRIRELLKNWTKEDFDLKSEIVDFLEEIPIEVNKTYGIKSYLRKLVDVLIKRMRNVIVTQQTGKIRKRSFASRTRKILTEEDMRDYVRAHLLDFLNECNSRICSDTLDDLETELVYLMMDSIDCIWCGHDDEILAEMNMILQDLGKMSDKQANCISNIMLQDLQDMLNNCVFNQTYTILNVSNNSGPYMNSTNNTDFSIGSIGEVDLDANLDFYTNQLCLQINQWLDTLNIPRIQDSGFREVVVNDLAGDIVDRHKYLELNHTGKYSEQDQLEALKYQIFKWINKLVGDDNQETISKAENLLQRINSVPIPMLVNPKHRSGGPCCEVDICPNTGQGSPKPYLEAAQGFNHSKPYSENKNFPNEGQGTLPQCIQGHPGFLPHTDQTDRGSYGQGSQTANVYQGTNHSESCCENKIRPTEGQGTLPQGIQGHPGFLPHTGQTDRGSYGQGSQTANVYQGTDYPESCCENKICPTEGQGTLPQGIQGHPGFLPHTGQTDRGSYSQGPQTANVYRPPQGQSSLNSRGSGRIFCPATNNPSGSNTFSSRCEPSVAGNLTQTGNVRHGNPSAGRMGTSGRTYGPMVNPNQQSMYDPNPQAMSVCCSESSTTRHVGSVPVKKLNEDYDEYLKEWVKKIPIAAQTPTEDKKAETARLDLYNGIWKGVTKMKLDPNIFGNQYYCQDVFEEEMERLWKDIPQSTELEAVKPTLKAELLQKTLAMNNLIKSTNAPASFKQQLIDNIENNLPKRTSTENEAENENDELDKQNMADYYILYTRYKDEENVKGIVHQKNFLKKLDEFLNKIKNRHNIADMNTAAYANEIIHSFDKIPTPTLLAIKDEADEILLALEVENWISDIPQKPDTAGPLEKRRTRDAIVKKIQEIASGVSLCENAFRIPLKADLPRYLEKIPIQEGTNVDYMIDELANRIKNLSTSIRRVSFQDPQNYEEFSRNMPAASSMHEMSDERSSYLVVGGDFVKIPGPRRPAWVSEQGAVPEEGMEWLSMEHTQMPSQMHSAYVEPQGMRSPQVYFPKDSGQMIQTAQSPQCCQPNASNIPRAQSPQVYNPNASYLDEGNIPRDAGPNRTWGSDKSAVPQKRQKLSMQESRTSPNMRNTSGRPESMRSQMYNPNESLTARSYPGEGNFVADAGPMRANWNQSAVSEEEIQWFSMEETQMPSQMHKTRSSRNKLGTEQEVKPPEEPKNNQIKPLDVNEKEVFNFKSVQTAFSTIEITTKKSNFCEIRSKSQEELTRKRQKHEIIKITDLAIRDLQQQLTNWFEIHSDNVKVKFWGEKMKKLAEKLKKPGGEEKLRNKIEKYLKRTPEQYPEADDENLEFRKQLPNDIIQKLKEMYLCPTDANFSINRMEVPKYGSRYKIDNIRKVVQNWMKTLNIKKKDFSGRNVKKVDIFKYVTDKLEPLVLDRPQSDSEYKEALQSSISEIVYELPLALSSHNKDFYLNKVTENLVDNIFMIERTFSSTYIQPTTKEIKEFVKDEITFFLEKCRIALSTKRMEYLEIELIDLLLDLTDIADIDNYVADDVTKLLQEVVKIPEYKAKYFSNLLLKDYKEFFFRENFFQLKGNSDFGRPDVYSAFQNATRLVDFNSATSFETYRQQLVEEINKWITKLNIPINDKNFIEVVVKDLASDIVDRYKYLLLNPNLTGTDVEELEQLKFQIFKWTNKLVGEKNTSVLEHAQELMNEINHIPKPSFQSTSVVQSMSPLNIDKINSNNTNSYIGILTDQIYDWYCELPIYLHTSQDARHNKILIKELAGEIEKGLEKKEDKVIDLEVSKWTEKVFNNNISNHYVQELKNRINNVPFTKDNRANDPKHEKKNIRSYEDIVDDWIDTVPIAPKKQEIFTNNKNEIVHAIAVKIFKIKTKIHNVPAEIVEKKLHEEISHWLKKLPLHVKVDNHNERDKYADKLVKSIQRHNMNEFLENQPKQTNDEPLVDQLEKVLLGWLKQLPMYREKSPEKMLHQETTIKRLAHKLIQTIDQKDADEDIIEHVRMLDPKQKDNYVKNTAFQLKSHLLKLNVYKDLCKQREEENKFLVDTTEVWLKGLPLQITDASRFNKQRTEFLKSIKRLISSGSDNAVMKKEILIFTRSLPISHKKKYDFRYLNEKVLKLIQSLNMEPIGDVPSQSPPSNTVTRHHHNNSNEIISDVIKEWTSTLPLKQVHCSRELRSFINDMSSVISSILLTPEHNSAEQNDAKLHREISKFLRRFPLIYELSTESHIFRMAGELSKTLKNISLFRNENSHVLDNVTVYGVSVENKTTSADYSIQSIKESDINENLETYTKQLVQQIGEWLDRLNLPDTRLEGFKDVAINDLAGDIVDRHKYLELNPNNTGSAEDELEHLKYQIFKWINKLVGEQNNETIGHAQELMQRVNSIPVPMLVRPQDKGQAQHPPSQHQRSQMNPSMGQRNNSRNVNTPIRTSGTREPGVSFRNPPSAQQAPSNRMNNSPPAQQATSNRMSDPNDLANPNSKPCCSKEAPPPPSPPEEGTKDAMYDKYVKIFRDQCNALPIDESTPYNATLADQARRAIYNGILKTFFNLKSDPKIENDYKYFEFMLEEKLDDFLDVLPQTEELKKIRHSWKIATIERAIEMLDELHKLSDKPCFRRTVKDKFNRQFALDNEIQYCFLLQQGFLSRMADAYILQTNYKEKDPVKANIYRNRLMMEVDKLANHLSKVHNVGFRFFDTSKLSRMAMKTLEHVPIPADDVLQEEVAQIHIADEIKKWYKELPTQPFKDENDGVFRKRMMEILAKKLNDMHKRLDDEDPSKEDKMKHEMSYFLEKRAELQENNDKHINFMVDQLHLRLQKRWAQLEDPGHFDDFEKAKPFSSTLAHVDNADFLAPLMDAATSTGPEPVVQRTHGGQEYFIQPGQPMQSMGQVRTSHRGASYSLQGFSRPGSPQKVMIHSMDPNILRQVPDGTRMSQGRPNERHVTQQGSPIQSMQAPISPRVNLEGSQFGPKQVNITQQSPTRANLSQQERQSQSRQQYPVVRQSPQLIQSTAHATPMNTRGASQIRSQRMQNVNESLRQVEFAGQTGPQPQRVEENVASQILGSDRQPGPLFVPCNQVHSQGRSGEVPGIVGSRGPTPTQGVGTTAQATTGAGGANVSSQEDILDGQFRVKCRCLEIYRRMRRSLDSDYY